MSIIDLLKLHWMIVERADCVSPYICFNDGDGDGGGDGDDGDGADGAGGAGGGADGGGDGDDDGDDDADGAADAEASDPGADPEADFDFQGFDPDITAPDAPGAPGYGANAMGSPEDVPTDIPEAPAPEAPAPDKEAATPFDIITVDQPTNVGTVTGAPGHETTPDAPAGPFGSFGLSDIFGINTAQAAPMGPPDVSFAPGVTGKDQSPALSYSLDPMSFSDRTAGAFDLGTFGAQGMSQEQAPAEPAAVEIAHQGPDPTPEFQGLYDAMFGPVGQNPQGLEPAPEPTAVAQQDPTPEPTPEPSQVAEPAVVGPQMEARGKEDKEPLEISPFSPGRFEAAYDLSPAASFGARGGQALEQASQTAAVNAPEPASYLDLPDPTPAQAQVAQAPDPVFEPQVDPHSTPSQDPNQGPFDARAGQAFEPGLFDPAAPAQVAQAPNLDWVNEPQGPAPSPGQAPGQLAGQAGINDINPNPLGAPEPPAQVAQTSTPATPPGPPSEPFREAPEPTEPIGREPGPELPGGSPGQEPGTSPVDGGGGPILPPSLAARSSGRDSITKALMDQNGGTPAVMYQSYLEAGFSPDQARQMVLSQMQNAPQVPGY